MELARRAVPAGVVPPGTGAAWSVPGNTSTRTPPAQGKLVTHAEAPGTLSGLRLRHLGGSARVSRCCHRVVQHRTPPQLVALHPPATVPSQGGCETPHVHQGPNEATRRRTRGTGSAIGSRPPIFCARSGSIPAGVPSESDRQVASRCLRNLGEQAGTCPTREAGATAVSREGGTSRAGASHPAYGAFFSVHTRIRACRT